MLVFMSSTIHSQSTQLTPYGAVLKGSADLDILGETFDAKMTVDKHLGSVSRAAAQRPGIMRMSWQVFHNRSLLLQSLWCFLLPVLEYCSAVLCCRFTPKTTGWSCEEYLFLAGGVLECTVINRRSAAALCMLFKIKRNPMHPQNGSLPLPYVPASVTRGALVAHRNSLCLLVAELLSIAGPLCLLSISMERS